MILAGLIFNQNGSALPCVIFVYFVDDAFILRCSIASFMFCKKCNHC